MEKRRTGGRTSTLPSTMRKQTQSSCRMVAARIVLRAPGGVRPSLTAPAVALLSMVALAGCQTQAIRASRLPRELQAEARSNSQIMDLSRVASPGVSDSLIGPRDLLKVTIATGRAGEEVVPATVRVATDGAVDVPVVGRTMVAGLEAYEASQAIAQAAVERGIFVHPYVTVEIESKAVKRVTVLGAVTTPGVHELPYNSADLVAALAAAGGLSEEAGTEVEIIRQPTLHGGSAPAGGAARLASFTSEEAPPLTDSSPQVIRLELSEGRFAETADTRLSDRDIVKVIPRKEDMIFVTGLVKTPGQYKLPTTQDIHLLDAIAMAGGQSSPVADKILVIRRNPRSDEPVFIRAGLMRAKRDSAENLRIAPGDTISIEQTPATVVVDTLRDLFRISFGLAGNASVF